MPEVLNYNELTWNKYSNTDNNDTDEDDDESYMHIYIKMAYNSTMCSLLVLQHNYVIFIGAEFKLHLHYMKFLFVFNKFVIIFKSKYISLELEEKLQIANS